ncbi:type II toxin-antitoxin system HigB family toxin [Spirosoma foliorum]|uniref:Type II toxin-antitoxin system HigB family toxin n=1 Tax=Spirosoma foliorum TaxID=2710596 RepID=A0A7G5H3U9_9BACT|nr:type II toxin-antitoxin system HigB family toxin [Spirosoma foliorum]QMW05791.1 type II toxin-antitoxin system HigB family toxin [Spirosoma foliorum]
MKLHLIRKETIEAYTEMNARRKSSFKVWLTVVKFADWQTPEAIKDTFGAADLLGNGTNRVVFDIGGNNYRMICKYAFGKNQVHLFGCWIETHAQYDKLCKRNDQYTVNHY